VEPTQTPTPGAPRSKRMEAERLLERAEVHRLAGNPAGALALLADALELGVPVELPARTEARIRLALVDAHEGLARTGHPGHAEIAEELRTILLADRVRLQLTDLEIEALDDPEPIASASAQAKPSPTAGVTNAAVAEKVIEAEVMSDRKMISGGTTMVTVGLGFATGGLVLLIFAKASEESLDEYKIPDQEDERADAIRDGAAQNGAGIAFVSLGGLLLATGATLLAVGVARKRKRLGEQRVEVTGGIGSIGVRF